MKRAIFVRSKTIVMTELDKKIREKEIYRVTLVGSFVNFLLVIFKFQVSAAVSYSLFLFFKYSMPWSGFRSRDIMFSGLALR